jgi:hypothetical protein
MRRRDMVSVSVGNTGSSWSQNYRHTCNSSSLSAISTATFENAANALITADKNLNQGRNEEVIRDVFVRRGIFPN